LLTGQHHDDDDDSGGVRRRELVCRLSGWRLVVVRVVEATMETGDEPTYKSPPRKMKKSSNGEPKTALQTLNEMMPGLKYDVTQVGQHHEPTFTVQVTVNDQVCAAGPTYECNNHNKR